MLSCCASRIRYQRSLLLAVRRVPYRGPYLTWHMASVTRCMRWAIIPEWWGTWYGCSSRFFFAHGPAGFPPSMPVLCFINLKIYVSRDFSLLLNLKNLEIFGGHLTKKKFVRLISRFLFLEIHFLLYSAVNLKVFSLKKFQIFSLFFCGPRFSK
jgi:hypothetical protein